MDTDIHETLEVLVIERDGVCINVHCNRLLPISPTDHGSIPTDSRLLNRPR